jgi:hypothetical protein
MKFNERFTRPCCSNLVEYCFNKDKHAVIRYIEPFEQNSLFPSTANPSIVYDEKRDCFWLNIRKTSYTLHTTNKDYNPGGHWGDLIYSICSDRGSRLETTNAVACLKDPMFSKFEYKYIKEIERPHIWDFVGNEDVRLAVWNNKLYETYIIRDDNKTGVSRVHYSELDPETMEEKTKVRLAGRNNDTSYCEKNWMPVADRPFTFISEADPEHKFLKQFDMMRGSSQLVPYKDGYISIIHTCQMWYSPNGRKSARYLHAFAYFDNELKLKDISGLFSFMDRPVEFCCGMTRKGKNFYITFSLQDNVSFILKTNEDTIDYIMTDYGTWQCSDEWFGSYATQQNNFEYAMSLFKKKDFSGAYTFFSRGIDMFQFTDRNEPEGEYSDVYKERFYLARCIAELGKRDHYELALWFRLLEYDDIRPEGLMAIAMYFFCRNQFGAAYYYGKKAMDNIDRYSGVYYSKKGMENCWHHIQQMNKNGIDGEWKKAF